MSDLLGRQLTEYGGSFSIDDALLTFPNLRGLASFVPYIVTNLGINYAQNLSRIYGLNRNQVFLVAGRTNGAANLAQVLAPGGDITTFLQTYGNVCRARENVLQFSLNTGCEGEQRTKTILEASMCLINQTSFSSEAQTAVVNNTISMSFESLRYLESSL